MGNTNLLAAVIAAGTGLATFMVAMRLLRSERSTTDWALNERAPSDKLETEPLLKGLNMVWSGPSKPVGRKDLGGQ